MLCSENMLASAQVHRLHERSFSLSQVATFFSKFSNWSFGSVFVCASQKNLKHGRRHKKEKCCMLGLSSTRGVTTPFEKVGVDDSTLAPLEDGAGGDSDQPDILSHP